MRCQQRRQHSTADSKTAAKPENTVSTHLLTLLMTPVALSFQQVMKKSLTTGTRGSVFRKRRLRSGTTEEQEIRHVRASTCPLRYFAARLRQNPQL